MANLDVIAVVISLVASVLVIIFLAMYYLDKSVTQAGRSSGSASAGPNHQGG